MHTERERDTYQRTYKEKAAIANGQPIDAYYDLPYASWAPIRDRWMSQFPTAAISNQ